MRAGQYGSSQRGSRPGAASLERDCIIKDQMSLWQRHRHWESAVIEILWYVSSENILSRRRRSLLLSDQPDISILCGAGFSLDGTCFYCFPNGIVTVTRSQWGSKIATLQFGMLMRQQQWDGADWLADFNCWHFHVERRSLHSICKSRGTHGCWSWGKGQACLVSPYHLLLVNERLHTSNWWAGQLFCVHMGIHICVWAKDHCHMVPPERETPEKSDGKGFCLASLILSLLCFFLRGKIGQHREFGPSCPWLCGF